MTIKQIKQILIGYNDPVRAESKLRFFKNCNGDVFLGIQAPVVKKLAKQFSFLELTDIVELISSNVHEERTLAHAILCEKFRKEKDRKKEIFEFYIQHRSHIREWNGVDDSAPYIAGAYLLDKDKQILYQLALSEVIWDRRIAIVATWWFIRHGQFQDTIEIAKILLRDKEDLIHKAVGWMLREVGKRDETLLRQFLKEYHTTMARTTLRYAIEKFPVNERKTYLTRRSK